MNVSARRGALYICVAAAAWGTGGAAGNLLFATADLGPIAVSFWRYLLGAALLLTLTRTQGTLSKARSRRPRTASILMIGVGMAAYQAAYFGAIQQTGVALATVVTMGATPVFTALGGRFFLGERLGGTGLIALATALLGLGLLTSGGYGAVHTGGIALALLSALGYASVTLASRKHNTDPKGTALGGFAVGALCLLPFALAEGITPVITPTTAALLVYLAAVPTALAYGLFFRALTALKATTVSVISLGEAVGAAVLGVAVFGERLTPLAVVGGVVLLGSVVVLTSHASKATPTPQVGRPTQEAA
ncbi:DMT family transporter [Nonomuraea sp. NPDC050556]|uniref:DMT family transporter n=1 Tax=Nonomuraea sp. NPDC050556 TaxID=3364369 RepID=UPI0037A9C8F8